MYNFIIKLQGIQYQRYCSSPKFT